MRVLIDPRRVRDVSTTLAGMTERLSDLTVPLSAGAKRGREDTIRDFETGGSFGGEIFAALSTATLERDKYHDATNAVRPTASHRPLDFSGQFRSTVRYFAEAFAAGVVLGPAYWLNYVGTTINGHLKNKPREGGYISDATVDWTAQTVLQYIVDNRTP